MTVLKSVFIATIQVAGIAVATWMQFSLLMLIGSKFELPGVITFVALEMLILVWWNLYAQARKS